MKMRRIRKSVTVFLLASGTALFIASVCVTSLIPLLMPISAVLLSGGVTLVRDAVKKSKSERDLGIHEESEQEEESSQKLDKNKSFYYNNNGVHFEYHPDKKNRDRVDISVSKDDSPEKSKQHKNANP